MMKVVIHTLGKSEMHNQSIFLEDAGFQELLPMKLVIQRFTVAM